MALFNPSYIDVDNDKVAAYLYKLNDDLTYMFNNLTPEDNYSKDALAVMAKEQDIIAELSVSVDGIFMNYLKGDSLISSIALDDSGVTIKADKISLEGLVTANSNFKILLDGSIEAKNGRFSGDIYGAKITGSTISGKGATSEFYIGADANNNIELQLGSYSIEESVRGSMTLYGMFGKSIVNSSDSTPFSVWSDGVIWGSDYFCPGYPAPRYTSSSSHYNSEDWFEGWSVQQTLIALWNCARSKGWNPASFDPNA